MDKKNRKFSFKIRRKILLFTAMMALGLTIWPTNITGIEAALDNHVSPVAVPVRNLWGAPRGETVDASLYQSVTGLGWSWSRENPVKPPGLSYIQPIYPSARIILKSPVTVGDIQSFDLFADYAYTRSPRGKYNLAFDIFLRGKGLAKDNRKSEIMVWLDWTQEQPSRYLKGSYSDGNYDYLLYSWTKKDSFDYHSFLLEPRSSLTARPVNLKALIDQVKPDKDWYISEVELGTEVWNGSGAVELSTFYLELNDTRL